MDYNKFVDKDTAFKGFVEYRSRLMQANSKKKFDDIFVDLGTKALEGDVIAQDCVAYFYNKGMPGYLKVNYDLYMAWEVLACANGNCFAMEKMEFFLKYAQDIIFSDDELLKTAIYNGNINKDNALYVISNLICESMVDSLHLDPKNLISRFGTAMPFSAELNRKYVKAMEDSVPIVAQYLMS